MSVGASSHDAAHDAVRSMLEARTDRLRPVPFDVPALVADVPQVAARSSWLSTLTPRLSVAAAAVGVVLVASALVVGPLLMRPAGSQVPTVGSAAVTSPRASNLAPEAVRALTATEVGDLARTRSAELASRLAAVRGTITVDAVPRCRRLDCSTVTLSDSGTGFVMQFHPSMRTELRPVGLNVTDGAFVIRFTSDVESEGPVVEILGRLITEQVDGFTSSVRHLVAEDPGAVGSFAAVDGWLVRSPLHPCASVVLLTPAPPNAPTYGCPSDEYLTDEAFQPAWLDGSSVGPESAIYLPVGSYQAWAPDPGTLPDGVVAPQRAVYLLRRDRATGCPGGSDCSSPISRWGVIAGRLDPIPVAPSSTTATPTPPDPGPSGPPVVTGGWPGGIPRSIGGQPVFVGLEAQQRIAAAVDDTRFLVGGPWFEGPQDCVGQIDFDPDPNPLAVSSCPHYRVEGLPRLLFPSTIALPEARGPVVLRVHTQDSRAATCRNVERCRQVVVVDEVVWAGDDATRSAPLDVGQAVGVLQGLIIADNRKTGPNENAFVDEDVFTIPIACPAPWPVLTYAVLGDPRLGLMGVFPSTIDRERFQASTEAAAAAGCLTDDIARFGPARWIGHANMLLLAFANDADAALMEDGLGRTPGSDGWKPIPLPGPDVDRGREIIAEYLRARMAGLADHAVGERLQLDQSDERIDIYAEWHADTFRRLAANALDGSITLVSDRPTETDVGTPVWRSRAPGSDLFVYRVDYAGATDPALASETFVVIHDPETGFADWMFVRIAGAPYPEVLMPPRAPEPSTSLDPATGGNGDITCGPMPCGEAFLAPSPSAEAR